MKHIKVDKCKNLKLHAYERFNSVSLRLHDMIDDQRYRTLHHSMCYKMTVSGSTCYTSLCSPGITENSYAYIA